MTAESAPGAHNPVLGLGHSPCADIWADFLKCAFQQLFEICGWKLWMGGQWKNLEVNCWFNYEWNWPSQHYLKKYFALHWLEKGVILQLCPQPGWCKSPGTFLMQAKSVEVEKKLLLNVGMWSWWWNVLSQGSVFLLGDLRKYWRTQPRGITKNFQISVDSFPPFSSLPGPIITCSFNYYNFLILLLLLLYYYTSPTDFWTAIRCWCLLGNVNLTLNSTCFIFFDQ